jgi:hypothetical protein
MVTLLDVSDPCPTGIEENSSNSSYGISNLYPVPVRDNLNFTLNSKENEVVTISVKDNIGREVLSQAYHAAIGENKVNFDLSQQSAGVYFITVKAAESTIVSKFVKQ